MTSPPEEIEVRCPDCGHVYRDWYRASLNLALDDFDDEYVREASTATCPECSHVVELGPLVVDRAGTFHVVEEDDSAAEAEPDDPEHPRRGPATDRPLP